MVSHKNLLFYPNFNKNLDIYTDESDLQFLSVIIQEDILIEFYSKQLTVPQTRYTAMENNDW